MDVWVAVIDFETPDEIVLGVYATEELALTAAGRASPGGAEAMHYVLNEIPEWVDGFEQEMRRLGADQASFVDRSKGGWQP